MPDSFLGRIIYILNAYIEFFRGTPMMAQAMFIYFGSAAFFIVSINTGAYMAETVRGGIMSIDPGQTGPETYKLEPAGKRDYRRIANPKLTGSKGVVYGSK